MEAAIGTIFALTMSLLYTDARMRKHEKQYTKYAEEHQALVERVDVMEQNLGRNMLSAMVPMSKSIKELQEAIGVR